MDRTRRLVANACRVTLWTEAVMADRPQMLASPAYATPKPTGKRAFHLVEGDVERGGVVSVCW